MQEAAKCFFCLLRSSDFESLQSCMSILKSTSAQKLKDLLYEKHALLMSGIFRDINFLVNRLGILENWLVFPCYAVLLNVVLVVQRVREIGFYRYILMYLCQENLSCLR